MKRILMQIGSKCYASDSYVAVHQASRPKQLLHSLRVYWGDTRHLLSEDPHSFFTGKISDIFPHLPSALPFGHTSFSYEIAQQVAELGQREGSGIVTLFLGSKKVFVVGTEEYRKIIVKEGEIGVPNPEAAEVVSWSFGHNPIMSAFSAFRPINSDEHHQQRDYLLKNFNIGSRERLPAMVASIHEMLQPLQSYQGGIRDFIWPIVLRNSSVLLGLSEWPLDNLWPKYEAILEHMPHYVISLRGNPAFNDQVFDLFLEIFERNFDAKQEGLIHNIFQSLGQEYPRSFPAFFALDSKVQRDIAYTFAAIALGGKVGSTLSTLDWFFANLLSDEKLLKSFGNLVGGVSVEELKDAAIFDMTGHLAPITEAVLRNAAWNPPFSYQFFHVSDKKPYSVTLPGDKTFDFPKDSIIIVSYVGCNRGNPLLETPEAFRKILNPSNTVSSHVYSNTLATFGGSPSGIKTRTCPAAASALYEEIAFAAEVLREFSVKGSGISLEQDVSFHPLGKRMNEGTLILSRRVPSSGT